MGTYRVYNRYIRIPGLRARTGDPWLEPPSALDPTVKGFRVKALGFRVEGLGFRV